VKNNNNKIIKWPKSKLDFSSGPLVMGVLNVMPDSFSDGGEFFDTDRAIERGLRMAAEGAAIIHVGAESTRPGSEGVSADEQIKRAEEFGIDRRRIFIEPGIGFKVVKD
jgi:dihydropteroate synthase